MVDGWERAEWARLSCLLTVIANTSMGADPDNPSYPSDFDPYEKQKEEPQSCGIEMLKIFVK